MTSGQGGGPEFGQPGWGAQPPQYGGAPHYGGAPYYRGPGDGFPQGGGMPPAGGPVPGGAPGPWQPYGAPPPKKSRVGLIIAVSTAAAVVIFGGVAVALGLSSGNKPKPHATGAAPSAPQESPADTTSPDTGTGRSLVIPASAGGYRHLTGSVADRTASGMRRAMTKSQGQYADVYAKAKIAIYRKSSDAQQSLIFIGMSGSDSPQIAAELQSRSASDEVDSVFMGMGVTDANDYPAGPLGGVLRCGKGATGSNAGCAWADGSVVGMVVAPLDSNVTTLARTTLALRNAAEH